MTTYLIAGDGDMPKRELHRTLTNLVEGDDNFGLALLARDETALDTKASDFAFEGDLEEWPLDEISAILEEFGGDSPAAMLAVFVNPRDEDPADDYLTTLIGVFNDAGFPSYALNDGMAQLDISGVTSDDEPVPASEEEELEVAVATVAAIEEMEAEEVEEVPADAPYTRGELEEMKIRELRALVSGLGLEISSRVKEDFVAAILGAQGDMVVPAGGDEPTVYDHDLEIEDGLTVEEVEQLASTIEHYESVGVNGSVLAVIHLRDRFVALTLTREQVEHLIDVGTEVPATGR